MLNKAGNGAIIQGRPDDVSVVQVGKTADFATAAKAAGALSIGAGSGYMGGVGMHVDISPGNTVALASAKYWGSGGRAANAPSWLRGIMA